MNLCSDPYCTICATLEQFYRKFHLKPQVSRSIAESQTSPQPALPPDLCYNCSAQLQDDPKGLILAQSCPKCGRTNIRKPFPPLPDHR